MSDTHETSKDMPKIAQTVQIGGIYKFNARYPLHLIGEHNGGKKIYRKSLKTGDWKTAQKRVKEAAYEFELEKERLENLVKRSSTATNESEAAFAQLDEAGRKKIVFQWFLQREKDSQKHSDRISGLPSDSEKSEALIDAKADFSDISDPEQVPHAHWMNAASKFLKEQKLHSSDSELEELADLFRAAAIEIERRSVERLTGESSARPDPRFEGLTAFSEIPTLESKGPTLGEICERFPSRLAEGKLKKSTLTSYEMPIALLCDFFGASKPLRSFSFSDAEKLVDFLACIPARKTQLYPRMTYVEAAKAANVAVNGGGLAAKTQEDRFTTIKSIFGYAEELGWIERNPFDAKVLRGKLPSQKEKV